MINVFHISTECFPAAKAGGMGDVLGALPKYLPDYGIKASVVIPKYKNAWFSKQKSSIVYEGSFYLVNNDEDKVHFKIEKINTPSLGFDLYAVNIPGKFDRASVYLDEHGEGYADEAERNISFQRAVLNWFVNIDGDVDIIHCHDHMTGLMPFMSEHVEAYSRLRGKPKFFTIHNGQYRGAFDWEKLVLLPKIDQNELGLLDWDGQIHSLACAIKCAWLVNTVSPSYMEELKENFDSLTSLVNHESEKCVGILNGIDTGVWDPVSDKNLSFLLKGKEISSFKSKNKQALLKHTGLKSRKPLLGFIGRFAYEKGADLIKESILPFLKDNSLSVVVLGSGDKQVEEELKDLAKEYKGSFYLEVAYNEPLARKIYAGVDFLLMPSRFEPCGLNQMYAMRYGSVPVVRQTGGLKDTVPDYEVNGHGIIFPEAREDHIRIALGRAIKLYKDKKTFHALRKKIMALDYSWDKSASVYSDYYKKIIKFRYDR